MSLHYHAYARNLNRVALRSRSKDFVDREDNSVPVSQLKALVFMGTSHDYSSTLMIVVTRGHQRFVQIQFSQGCGAYCLSVFESCQTEICGQHANSPMGNAEPIPLDQKSERPIVMDARAFFLY